MARFVCIVADCPNKDIVYDFGNDNPSFCQCGGCQIMLSAIDESNNE